MKFNDYQEKAWQTAIYKNKSNNLIYPTLGLTGEAGEFANKVKKIERDANNEITFEIRRKLTEELGDILWYISALAMELDIPLSFVASINLEKLHIRQQKNTLHGEGDER